MFIVGSFTDGFGSLDFKINEDKLCITLKSNEIARFIALANEIYNERYRSIAEAITNPSHLITDASFTEVDPAPAIDDDEIPF